MIAPRPVGPVGACANAAVREQNTANDVSVRIELFIQYLCLRGFSLVLVWFMRSGRFANYISRSPNGDPQLAGDGRCHGPHRQCINSADTVKHWPVFRPVLRSVLHLRRILQTTNITAVAAVNGE